MHRLRSERPRRGLVIAAPLLAAWILVPFWGIVTLKTVNVQDDIFASDLWNDRLPMRAFVGASLRRGESPAWAPGIYTGFPALAQTEVGALYPSNVALFTLLSPYTAIAWAQVLPLAIAGVGTFLLAEALGLPLAACLLSAGAFSLSGFLIAHLRQLNMVDAACWVPLLLLGAERIAAGRAGRAPLIFIAAWALQLLAGHPQVSYYTALVVAAYFVVRVWQAERGEPDLRRRRGARIGRLVVAFGFGTLLAAAQLLPTVELARSTYRQGGLSYASASQYAVSPLALWTFFVPGLFGDARDDTFRLTGLYWEQYGYLGLAPPLLVVAALVVRRRVPVVRLLAAVAAVSCLLMLGPATPVFRLAFAYVPGMSYFRFPTRFLLFVDLALALLAGFGAAACLEAVGAGWKRRALTVSLLTFTAADLWLHQMRQVPQIELRRWLAPIGTEQILASLRREHPEPWRYYVLDAPFVHGQTYHAAHGWSGDLEPYVRLRALLQPSFNLLFGLESPDGYANLVPREYEAVWGSEKRLGIVPTRHLETGELEPALASTLRLFNVRYLLSATRVRSPALRHVARSDEGVDVYEIADPLPRAFVVADAMTGVSDEAAVARLAAADFDAERQALVADDDVSLPLGSAASRSVDVVRRSNTEIVLRARLDKPGLLVLSEGHYPGWQVAVDGGAARLLRVNAMMRGVVVPAGDHEVVFRFRSKTIAVGFAISGAALLVLAIGHRRIFADG